MSRPADAPLSAAGAAVALPSQAEKRVRARYERDVVVPAAVGATFEGVQPERVFRLRKSWLILQLSVANRTRSLAVAAGLRASGGVCLRWPVAVFVSRARLAEIRDFGRFAHPREADTHTPRGRRPAAPDVDESVMPATNTQAPGASPRRFLALGPMTSAGGTRTIGARVRGNRARFGEIT